MSRLYGAAVVEGSSRPVRIDAVEKAVDLAEFPFEEISNQGSPLL